MIEREVKLSAWPGFRLPDLDGVAPGARTRRRETVDLDATYLDTADLRLGRRGITLRHRRRGARETWTLKLPSDGASDMITRREIDVPGPPGDVPDELSLLVAADVRTARLVRVARLVTVRRRTVVVDEDEQPLVEIDDDEVSVMDGGRVAARFRELEVEIAPDVDEDTARRVVARLERAGASPSEQRPKLAQALGPAFADPPEVSSSTLPEGATAGDVVRAALRASARRLLDHHAVAVEGDDSEGVHQMRVAARRLRSDLRTFRPLLDRAVTDPLRQDLRGLGEILGAVRDADVLAPRLERRASDILDDGDRPALDSLLARLSAERSEATATMLEHLGSDGYRRLLDRVVAIAENPPLEPGPGAADAPAASAARLVYRPWKRLRRLVAEIDHRDDHALHEVRKGAKAVRYACEAVEPAVGPPARRAGRRVKRIQTTLGDLQDTVVAESWLRTAVAGDDTTAAEAFVAGALVAAMRLERARGRDRWDRDWDDAADPQRWSWVR